MEVYWTPFSLPHKSRLAHETTENVPSISICEKKENVL